MKKIGVISEELESLKEWKTIVGCWIKSAKCREKELVEQNVLDIRKKLDAA